MSVQELYFRTQRRICAAMASFSDAATSAAFTRLGESLTLMDLRLAGTQDLTIDRKGSGLPILKEAVSLMLDIRNGVACDDDPERVRALILDHMMGRRRRPEPAMLTRMARAVYAATLRESYVGAFETEPQAMTLSRLAEGAPLRAAWDYWDGVTSSPISVQCSFAAPPALGRSMDEPRLLEVARLFSGAQFKPITLASEIDERIQALRLKELSKLRIGPFESDVFTEGQGGFAPFLGGVDDSEESWTMSWSTETLRSSGTAHRGGGWFRAARPYEMFSVDVLDPDRATRGVSDFELHTLMPHAVYQAVADSPEASSLLGARRIHVLSGDGSLTENV